MIINKTFNTALTEYSFDYKVSKIRHLGLLSPIYEFFKSLFSLISP
jgi:hypothetical protein